MLADRPLMAFIPVKDLSAARSFYDDVLGLPVSEAGSYAVVLDAGGTMLRLAQVDDLQRQPFTIAGWQVPDMEMSIDSLESRGVECIRFEGMDQDERGILSTPGGDRVAWFNDPDGNTLSLTWFAEQGTVVSLIGGSRRAPNEVCSPAVSSRTPRWLGHGGRRRISCRFRTLSFVVV